jgi:hypothetical protein
MMHIVKEVNSRDIEGTTGKRGIFFSEVRPTVKKLILNKLQSMADCFEHFYVFSHPVGKIEADLNVTNLLIRPILIPKGATHFRILNHISSISDYEYSEVTHCYEATSDFNAKSAFKYSEYTSIDATLTADIKATFPVGTIIDDACTIIQCMGIEFYKCTNGKNYLLMIDGSMSVIDVY